MKHHKEWIESLQHEFEILTGFPLEESGYPFYNLYNQGYSVERAMRQYLYGPALVDA